MSWSVCVVVPKLLQIDRVRSCAKFKESQGVASNFRGPVGDTSQAESSMRPVPQAWINCTNVNTKPHPLFSRDLTSTRTPLRSSTRQ